MLKKIILLFLTFNIFICFSVIPVFAQNSPYQFKEITELTPEEENLWRYKMQRITIKNESGNWAVVQGINTPLTDVQLLKLIGKEELVSKKFQNEEFKSFIASGVAFLGLGLTLVSALFATSIIPFDNGLLYGVIGIISGLAIIITAYFVNPPVEKSPDEHVISIQDAFLAAEIYNKALKKSLGIVEKE